MFGGTDFTVPSVVVYQYCTGFEDLVQMGIVILFFVLIIE